MPAAMNAHSLPRAQAHLWEPDPKSAKNRPLSGFQGRSWSLQKPHDLRLRRARLCPPVVFHSIGHSYLLVRQKPLFYREWAPKPASSFAAKTQAASLRFRAGFDGPSLLRSSRPGSEFPSSPRSSQALFRAIPNCRLHCYSKICPLSPSPPLSACLEIAAMTR